MYSNQLVMLGLLVNSRLKVQFWRNESYSVPSEARVDQRALNKPTTATSQRQPFTTIQL